MQRAHDSHTDNTRQQTPTSDGGASRSAKGDGDVVAADDLVVDGEVGLAAVVAGREDGDLHVKVGWRELVLTLTTQTHNLSGRVLLL